MDYYNQGLGLKSQVNGASKCELSIILPINLPIERSFNLLYLTIQHGYLVGFQLWFEVQRQCLSVQFLPFLHDNQQLQCLTGNEAIIQEKKYNLTRFALTNIPNGGVGFRHPAINITTFCHTDTTKWRNNHHWYVTCNYHGEAERLWS